jgi:hypothetical protein
MRILCLAALLFTTPLPAPVAAADIAGSEFTSGFWVGAADADPAGQFKLCHVSISYTGGETLWINLYPDDVLTVLLAKTGVSFKPGQTFPAQLMTEVGLPTYGTAQAVDQTYAGMSLNGIDSTVDYLTQGAYLRMLGIGIDQAFDIRGIGGALAQARGCMETYGKGASANTAASAGAGGAAPAPAPGGTGLGTKPGRDTGLGTPAPKPSP